MKQQYAARFRQLLRRDCIGIVAHHRSEMGLFISFSGKCFLYRFIAHRLIVELALENNPNPILVGNNVNTLVAAALRTLSIPANALKFLRTKQFEFAGA